MKPETAEQAWTFKRPLWERVVEWLTEHYGWHDTAALCRALHTDTRHLSPALRAGLRKRRIAWRDAGYGRDEWKVVR